ncbi:unnamed protein product, partial [Staurois parvus]
MPIGICKHIWKDTRGSMGPLCEFLVVAGQYLCSPPHQLALHLWDSPCRQVILQCWYVKDQNVL